MDSNINLISNEILDLIHYKIIENIRCIIKNKNHSNIIIYGSEGCGKTTIIKNLFIHLYGNPSILENNLKLKVYGNKLYYYIHANMIYDKEYFKKYIDSLVQSYDYYNNKIKYVIIDDFDCINITTQRYLKVILEKTFKTTRFILITNKLNSIDIAIISRCSLIRIPTPSYVDKKIYLTNLFNKHGIFYNDFLLEKDCKSNTLEGIIHKYQLNQAQIYNK